MELKWLVELVEKVYPLELEKLTDASAWLKVQPDGLELLEETKLPPSLQATEASKQKIKIRDFIIFRKQNLTSKNY